MQGAPPLASPGLSRRQHGLTLRNSCPAGGLSGWLPADRATVVSARGACFLCRLLAPAFSLLCCPHPPDPLPGGKGGAFSFLMQGAPPLASPGLNRRQHGLTLRNRDPAGACPVGCRLTVPLWCPQGGACLPCRLPAPALSLLYCPHPPSPLPGGKGETKSLFRRGLPPPAPLH